jgi:hypothetical protein
MLLDLDNPYRGGAPARLRLTAEDFTCRLSSRNREALGRPVSWSVLAYLAADCDLAECLFDNLTEMKAVGSGPDLHLMTLFDGPLLTDAFFARLNPDTRLREDLLVRYGELETHKPEVLTLALHLAGLYPGEKRALFLGGHGRGWRGALLDENRGLNRYRQDPAWLDLPGTYEECFGRLQACNRQVQEDLNRHLPAPAPARPLDVLAFDACFMGNIEAVATLAEQAHFLVVTENQMPGQGYPYHRVLTGLAREPELTAEEFCRRLVQETKDRYSSPRARPSPVTQVALRAGRLPEVIATFRRLVQELVPLLDTDAAIRRATRYALEMAWPFPETDSVDLKDLVLKLLDCHLPQEIRRGAQAFLEAWSALVLSSSPPEESGGRHGLAIYAPRPERFDPAYLSLANTLPLGLGFWSWFLARYYLQVLGQEAPRHPLLQAIRRTMEEMIRQGLYLPPKDI